LYYNSPTTIGNPNLRYEETTNYEVGAKHFTRYITISSSVFYNDASNIIDWVLLDSEALWMTKNIAVLKTLGFEINLFTNFEKLFPRQPINSITLSYTYLNTDYNSSANTSRYLLKYLEHQGIISINHNLIWKIKIDWYFRYEERYNSESNFITDIGVNKSFNNFNVFVKATNLFNVDYYDFIGVPLPGRWATAGVKYQLN
jgi:iron complex outermembrane receptor protein